MNNKGIIFFDELLFQRLNNIIEFTRIVKENHFDHIPQNIDISWYEACENSDYSYMLDFLSSIYNSYLGVAVDVENNLYLFDKIPTPQNHKDNFVLTKIITIPNAWHKATELLKEIETGYVWYKDYRNRIYTAYEIKGSVIEFEELLP